jgi:hypothetical protein
MSNDIVLTLFIIAVGLSFAAAGTHLYQAVWRERAALRFDGRSYLATLGHLAMSFLCGPYIMLQLGWQQEPDDTISIGSALLSSFIAFGWSFIVGLLLLGSYMAALGH